MKVHRRIHRRFAVAEEQWHDHFLSALAAGVVGLSFIACKGLAREHYRRRRAFQEGEEVDEAPLGSMWHFSRTRPGKTVLFILWAVFMIGLIALMAYDMERCPRLSEGLC